MVETVRHVWPTCRRTWRDVVKIGRDLTLSLTAFAVGLRVLNIQTMTCMPGLTVVMGAAWTSGLSDSELSRVEQQSVGIGDIKKTFLFFQVFLLCLDIGDGSFSNTVLQGLVLFRCGGNGKVALFYK